MLTVSSWYVCVNIFIGWKGFNKLSYPEYKNISMLNIVFMIWHFPVNNL